MRGDGAAVCFSAPLRQASCFAFASTDNVTFESAGAHGAYLRRKVAADATAFIGFGEVAQGCAGSASRRAEPTPDIDNLIRPETLHELLGWAFIELQTLLRFNEHDVLRAEVGQAPESTGHEAVEVPSVVVALDEHGLHGWRGMVREVRPRADRRDRRGRTRRGDRRCSFQ